MAVRLAQPLGEREVTEMGRAFGSDEDLERIKVEAIGLILDNGEMVALVCEGATPALGSVLEVIAQLKPAPRADQAEIDELERMFRES